MNILIKYCLFFVIFFTSNPLYSNFPSANDSLNANRNDSVNINIPSQTQNTPIKAIKEENMFFGIAFDYYQNPHQASYNLSFRTSILNRVDAIDNFLQFDFLGVDKIAHDKYNGGKQNSSFMFTYYMVCLVFSSPVNLFVKENERFGIWIFLGLMVPIGLTNASYGYCFYNYRTYNRSFFMSSIYFRTKLDYFENQDNKFFRYKPELGIELGHIFDNKKPCFGLFVSFGYDYGIDFVNHKVLGNNPMPDFAIKLGYGGL